MGCICSWKFAPRVPSRDRAEDAAVGYNEGADGLRELQEGTSKAKHVRAGQGMWDRMFGISIPVR
ncbi:hypothetical protein MGN70_008008 [Eutypa lata]|nr:hypothetical protein MGN70_008008 [Eutypa lata]